MISYSERIFQVCRNGPYTLKLYNCLSKYHLLKGSKYIYMKSCFITILKILQFQKTSYGKILQYHKIATKLIYFKPIKSKLKYLKQYIKDTAFQSRYIIRLHIKTLIKQTNARILHIIYISYSIWRNEEIKFYIFHLLLMSKNIIISRIFKVSASYLGTDI